MSDKIYIALASVALVILLSWLASRPKEGLINGPRREVTLHYTPWCGVCSAFKPVWHEFVAGLPQTISHREVNEDHAHTPFITRVPTISLIDENGQRHLYKGRRELAAMRAWVLSPVIV